MPLYNQPFLNKALKRSPRRPGGHIQMTGKFYNRHRLFFFRKKRQRFSL
jgi:hypothetical protein